MSQQPHSRISDTASDQHYVTVGHLRDALESIAAPMRLELSYVRRDVDAIAKRLDARPVQRWLVGRATQILDKGVPFALVAAATYALTHFL